MGNNFLIIVGVIVLVKVINESESSEMEEFDLMVCVNKNSWFIRKFLVELMIFDKIFCFKFF